MLKKILTWFGKYLENHADFLANSFGVLFVLAIGAIIFALSINILDSLYEWEWQFQFFWLIIIISAVTGVLSLILLFYFSWQVSGFEKRESELEYKDAKYIISKWSLKTLRAAGVGRDIIIYLTEEILQKSTSPEDLELTITDMTALPDDSWLAKLRNDLGSTRVEEFEKTILKYTRREIEGNLVVAVSEAEKVEALIQEFTESPQNA